MTDLGHVAIFMSCFVMFHAPSCCAIDWSFMRRLFILASLIIILSLIWLRQNPQLLDQALAMITGTPTNNTQLDNTIHSADKPSEQGLKELPFMYRTLPDNSNEPRQSPNQTTRQSSAKTIQALNLNLPSTIHPASPALALPDRPASLILQPKQNAKPGISVGGGIEWDEKNAKAKGVKISIKVPTG
jgi:hypothetical protein